MIIVIQAKTQAYRCQISALDTSATDIEEQEDFMDVTTNVKITVIIVCSSGSFLLF